MWGFELGWHGWGELAKTESELSVQAARVRMPDIRTYRALLRYGLRVVGACL